MDTAYSTERKKQVYNYYNGNIIEFQPGGNNTRHGYSVSNTADEVPVDVLRQMLDDGLITKPEYNKLIKNKK